MRFMVYVILFLLLTHSPLISGINLKNISLQKICDELGMSTDQCCYADKALKFLGYGGLAAAAGTYGVPFILAQLGFSATGVIGGSIAAWWQAMGIAPGLFSAIQSTAMTGAAAALTTKLGVTASAVKSYFSSCDSAKSTGGKDCEKNCQ